MKIAFVGADSLVFTKNLPTDIPSFTELRGASIALHDISPERLETAGMVARWTSEQLEAGARVEEPPDLRDALEGADFVIKHGPDRDARGDPRGLRGSKTLRPEADHHRLDGHRRHLPRPAQGNELARLDDLLGARSEAEVAILLDWNCWWALELDSKPSADVRLLDGLRSFYAPLYEANVPVDFAHPGADLSPYKLVVAPNLYLVTDDSAENIRHFVADGGTLLIPFFSGISDANDHIRLGGYPAPFKDLLGLVIEDFFPMATGETNVLDTRKGESFQSDLWADLIHLRDAESLAWYAEGFYAGTPAVTRNAFGDGAAYYLGTRPEGRYVEMLVQTVCERAGVDPTIQAPPGIDAVRRKTEDASFLFLLNHNDKAVEVRLPVPGLDLLTEKEHDSMLMLDSLEVAVLREAPRG